MTVAPVAQGGFGVGLESLAQPIQGGTMERHRRSCSEGFEPSSRVQMLPEPAVWPCRCSSEVIVVDMVACGIEQT